MKLTQKIGYCIALLAIIVHTTYPMEAENNGWLNFAKSTLINGYSGFKQFLSNATTPGTGFSDLPIEVQTTIIQLFAKSCADTTLKDAAKTINSLAQTSTHLNNLINNPDIDLQLIKSRAKQFNVSDLKVAKELQTKASKVQLKIQLALAKIIKDTIEEQENNGVLPQLNSLVEGFEVKNKLYKVDLNFTYRWNQRSQEYSSPLMYAVQNDNKFLIQYLLKHDANINQAGFNGKTPLMYADNPDIITFLIKQPGLNINQQDTSGNTALLRAIQHYFPEDRENRDQDIAVIQTLIDNGANPTIANNTGDGPLKAAQATGDQEVIDIVQEAIDKM
jgi:ankyrin repeat protein